LQHVDFRLRIGWKWSLRWFEGNWS
jgi:hypothetical protein